MARKHDSTAILVAAGMLGVGLALIFVLRMITS
jgi:hypothetical protein